MLYLKHTALALVLITACHSGSAMVDNPSGAEKPKYTSIHEAVKNNCLESLQYWIKQGKIEEKDDKCNTPLLCAAQYGQIDCLKLLLENGAHVEAQNDKDLTPLMYAAQAQLALELGKKIYPTHPYEFGIFIYKKCIHLLLNNGAHLETTDNAGYTALMHCPYEILIKLLIKKGANLETTTKNGFTPLALATWKGSKKCVELLLNAPFMQFSHRELMNVLQELPQNTVPISSNEPYKQLDRMLMVKVKNKTLTELTTDSGIQQLIKQKTKLVLKKLVSSKKPKYPSIHKAVEAKCLQSLQYWILKGNIEEKNEQGLTPLQYATMLHTNEDSLSTCLELLINEGADFEVTSKECPNPIITLVVAKGCSDVLKLLISKNAYKNERDQDKTPIFHLSIKYGHLECFKLLLKSGADLEAKNKDGFTPLIYAINLRLSLNFGIDIYKKCINLLIKKGANPEATDAAGSTALILCALAGDYKQLDLLIKKGAHLEATNQNGESALFAAIIRGHKRCIELLLKGPFIQDEMGIKSDKFQELPKSPIASLEPWEQLDRMLSLKVQNKTLTEWTKNKDIKKLLNNI